MTVDTNKTDEKSPKGPLTVEFIDDSTKAHKRIPTGVNALRVTERATNTVKDYALDGLPAEVINMLAAAGFKKLVETHTRNLKDEDGTNVISSADAFYGVLLGGTIYTRVPGEKSEKKEKFDFDFWGKVVTAFYSRKTKGQQIPQAKYDQFMDKLASATPKERKERLDKLKKDDPVWRAAFNQIKDGERIAKSGTTSTLDELF